MKNVGQQKGDCDFVSCCNQLPQIQLNQYQKNIEGTCKTSTYTINL